MNRTNKSKRTDSKDNTERCRNLSRAERVHQEKNLEPSKILRQEEGVLVPRNEGLRPQLI
jgi:hypothetical protein